MQNVLLTIHLIACIALVISVMLQRSEGGALGMGGGGTGGLISGRGAAGVLVKTTMGLAAIFFITSISMTYLHNQDAHAPSILDRTPVAPATTTPAAPAPTGPDPLSGATTTPPAAATPAAPAPSAATPDPLSPNATPPATTPAPATTPPTAPATPPENGGSPN